MKVFIATPAYKGQVESYYAQSLLAGAMDCRDKGIQVVSAILANCIHIDDARNVLVDEFLKTDCTHLFFIDSDIGFPADSIARLVQSGKSVTAGVCPQRTENKFCCVPSGYEYKGWHSFERVGTGFMCIRRDVLEYWEAPIVDGVKQVFKREVNEGKRVGEDYAFCDNLCDDKPWVWPDIEFRHGDVVANYKNSLIHHPAHRNEIHQEIPA